MSEIEDLVAAVQGLQSVGENLTKWSEDQTRVLRRIEDIANDTRRNRTGIQVATIAVVLSLIVGGFAGVQSMRLNRVTHQVQDVQQRTSIEVLCPLYQLFTLSIRVNPPPPNYTPEQLKLRQQFAEAMAIGLDKLGCPEQ